MSAIELIAAERKRQIEQEGYSPEHDDKFVLAELERAAMCYLLPPGPLREQNLHGEQLPRFWPWSGAAWKPMEGAFTIEGRKRELVKAGALIVAAIDRLDRPTAREFHKSEAEKENSESVPSA